MSDMENKADWLRYFIDNDSRKSPLSKLKRKNLEEKKAYIRWLSLIINTVESHFREDRYNENFVIAKILVISKSNWIGASNA